MIALLKGLGLIGLVSLPTALLVAIGIGITALAGQTACAVYAGSIGVALILYIARDIGRTL